MLVFFIVGLERVNGDLWGSGESLHGYFVYETLKIIDYSPQYNFNSKY